MKPFKNYTLLNSEQCSRYIEYLHNDPHSYDMHIKHAGQTEYFRKQHLSIIRGKLKDQLDAVIAQHYADIFEYFGHMPNDPCILEDTFVCRYSVKDYVKPHCDDIHSKLFNYKYHRRYFNFSVNLNLGYDGGLLWLEGAEPAPAILGNMNVFCNPHPHQVTPITAGERFTVIGWIYDTE